MFCAEQIVLRYALELLRERGLRLCAGFYAHDLWRAPPYARTNKNRNFGHDDKKKRDHYVRISLFVCIFVDILGALVYTGALKSPFMGFMQGCVLTRYSFARLRILTRRSQKKKSDVRVSSKWPLERKASMYCRIRTVPGHCCTQLAVLFKVLCFKKSEHRYSRCSVHVFRSTL